jgi:prepilin-type N-terminal cleavage/methylation domain-containing protein
VTRQSTGFTLVELLVVIAIIGVLMGLLFPAVISALSSAEEATCQSNISQLAKVMLAYCSDFGSFPLRSSRTTPATASNWLYTINQQNRKDFTKGLLMDNKYIGDEEILYCPADKNRGLVRPAGALLRRLPTGENVAPTSYVVNASITWGDYPWNPTENRSRVRSRNASDFDPVDFLFIEQSSGVEPEPASKFDEGYMYPNPSTYSLTARHRDGGFVGCMDGHAEWISTEHFRRGMQQIGASRVDDGRWPYKIPTPPTDPVTGKFYPEIMGARWNPG